MKRIKHYASIWDGEGEHLLKLLQEWQPESFDLSEKAHENALKHWLASKLPEVPIAAQYGIAKGKADLVIQDHFVIELKLAFDEDKVGEFDRCLGQLERYRQKWVLKDRGPVFLVVVGAMSPDYREMLHVAVKRLNSEFEEIGHFDRGEQFFIVEKS